MIGPARDLMIILSNQYISFNSLLLEYHPEIWHIVAEYRWTVASFIERQKEQISLTHRTSFFTVGSSSYSELMRRTVGTSSPLTLAMTL